VLAVQVAAGMGRYRFQASRRNAGTVGGPSFVRVADYGGQVRFVGWSKLSRFVQVPTLRGALLLRAKRDVSAANASAHPDSRHRHTDRDKTEPCLHSWSA
jgi:hypothetical protein